MRLVPLPRRHRAAFAVVTDGRNGADPTRPAGAWPTGTSGDEADRAAVWQSSVGGPFLSGAAAA
jgi:hypothetical protein